jgi:hypothetical protein
MIMTQTAAPERATRIPQVDDRVIIAAFGTFDGHQGRIERISSVGTISVRLDVTGQVNFYDRADLIYPDGSELETYEQQRAREMRKRTLDRLHAQARTLRPLRGDRESAIVTMAARYGAAERLKGGDTWDIDLSYSAASRRFSALQRLVYGV